MRLEQLTYLIAVDESKSISLAAERAHISQPALSSAISKLEDELGVVLLKRTNSGAHLTKIGELIIIKAKEVLNSIDEIKSIAHGNSIELNGNISIAVEPSVNITIMPDILTTFKHNHPKVNALLKVGESNNILRDMTTHCLSSLLNGLHQLKKSNLMKDSMIVGLISGTAGAVSIELLNVLMGKNLFFGISFSSLK